VFNSAVHQVYSPVCTSVNVILPVYYPDSSGVIFREYVLFFPGPIVSVGGPDAPTRSVSTSYVILLSVNVFLNTKSYLVEALAWQLMIRWSTAKGSSPIPFRSYSKTSFVEGLVITNFASH